MPWFTPEAEQLCQRKKKAYIQYLTTKTPENWINNKAERNIVSEEIRKLKKNY